MSAESGPLQIEAQKYLTFKLDAEVYGLAILKVQEIIGMMNVTRVPRVPDVVRGVINLRGKVIPVIDLRLRFGSSEAADTERTCIIVVQMAEMSADGTMGVIVDEVSEVIDIPVVDIEEPPEFGAGVDTRFLLGMGKVGRRVVLLLDIDEVLSGEDVAAMAGLQKDAEAAQGAVEGGS